MRWNWTTGALVEICAAEEALYRVTGADLVRWRGISATAIRPARSRRITC